MKYGSEEWREVEREREWLRALRRKQGLEGGAWDERGKW